jgi:hypothetical protein
MGAEAFVYLVAWGGIEPPTRGFSIHMKVQLDQQLTCARFYKDASRDFVGAMEKGLGNQRFVEAGGLGQIRSTTSRRCAAVCGNRLFSRRSTSALAVYCGLSHRSRIALMAPRAK